MTAGLESRVLTAASGVSLTADLPSDMLRPAVALISGAMMKAVGVAIAIDAFLAHVDKSWGERWSREWPEMPNLFQTFTPDPSRRPSRLRRQRQQPGLTQSTIGTELASRFDERIVVLRLHYGSPMDVVAGVSAAVSTAEGAARIIETFISPGSVRKQRRAEADRAEALAEEQRLKNEAIRLDNLGRRLQIAKQIEEQIEGHSEALGRKLVSKEMNANVEILAGVLEELAPSLRDKYSEAWLRQLAELFGSGLLLEPLAVLRAAEARVKIVDIDDPTSWTPPR